MKRAVYFIIWIAASAICNSQSSNPPAGPDLSRFSSAQLQACYDNKSICGADVYEISDELTSRLPSFSTAQLVDCFANWKICGVGNDLTTGWAVSREVARRGNPHRLLIRYWTEPDENVRYGILHVAYHFNSPEVTNFMRRVLSAGRGDDDYLYWPADYLARRCDPAALKWLSTRVGRPEGCILWAPTVAYFGKCRYRPAIPYLVENSIHDACLNIVDAAAKDLSKLYPDSPKTFDSLGEMQKYYCARAHQEGYKVACTTQ